MTRPGVTFVKLVRVTYTTGTGIGTDDPVREVDAFYDLNGALVFEIDAWSGPTTTARSYSWTRSINPEPEP